jgi:hypothetical protein
LPGQSELLTVNGYGHTSLFKSSCADRYVSRYLLTGRIPPAGTVCGIDVVPFAGPAAAAAKGAAHAHPLPPALAEAQRG